MTKAGAWAADLRAEGSSPWIGNHVGGLSTACPWKAYSWEMLSLTGVGTKYRQTVGNEGDAQFCCSEALSLPVGAGIEQKMVLRELLFLAACIPN